MTYKGNLIFVSLVLISRLAFSQEPLFIPIPYLENEPVIDGDLNEWKEHAYTDGTWDIFRVRQTPWYDERKNRLTDHNDEKVPIEYDLAARYYMAWDDRYLYLGAEVVDNVNDVVESKHAPKRWYYKDAIAWFIEAPGDDIDEIFGQGDHAFAFVIDTARPDYSAWWRHGTPDSTFIEEPLPKESMQYAIGISTWEFNAFYTLEVRIDMQDLFPIADPDWKSPKLGDMYRIMIVHCDPDGGEYGGHLLIYGSEDSDMTWSKMILTGPVGSLKRKEK